MSLARQRVVDLLRSARAVVEELAHEPLVGRPPLRVGVGERDDAGGLDLSRPAPSAHRSSSAVPSRSARTASCCSRGPASRFRSECCRACRRPCRGRATLRQSARSSRTARRKSSRRQQLARERELHRERGPGRADESGPAPPASAVRVASQLLACRVALTVTPLPRALNGSTAFSTRHSAPSAPPVVSSQKATSAESWAIARDAGTAQWRDQNHRQDQQRIH